MNIYSKNRSKSALQGNLQDDVPVKIGEMNQLQVVKEVEFGVYLDGGELDWKNPRDMTSAFDKAIGKLQSGELSAPFRTQFGWHIVKLIDRREQDQTESLLIAQAREAVRGRKAREKEELWRRRLRAEAYIEYRVADLAPDTGQ